MFKHFHQYKNENDISIQINDTERRIIIRALADLRDEQRSENKSFDFLDSLIVKICDAKAVTAKKQYER